MLQTALSRDNNDRTGDAMEHKLHSLSAENFKLDASVGEFEGYASTFNGIDSYGDTVLPGAYKETLQNRERPVAMFFNHISRRADMPAKIGTYHSLEEDERGLKVRGKLTLGHPTADAVLASMKAGAISGLSIGYSIPKGGSEKNGNIRLLKRIELYEVSVVDDPADLGAQVDRASIKSAVDEMKSLADAEQILREVGCFSANAATDFVSKLRSVIRREAEKAGTRVTVPTGLLAELASLTLPKSIRAN